MRCCYMSDLHLETQDYRWPLPAGDVLIIAGDLCHARCLAAGPDDPPALKQRDRVLRLADAVRARFAHVLLAACGPWFETPRIRPSGYGGAPHHDGSLVESQNPPALKLRRWVTSYCALVTG
jgi:hypothetical protein